MKKINTEARRHRGLFLKILFSVSPCPRVSVFKNKTMITDLIHIDVEKQLMAASGAVTLKVQLIIQQGELLVLFGPSGEGKTTILRMLAGLLRPDKGTIRYGNTVWFDASAGIDLPPQQRHIGFVFQDYALFPAMTVAQNLAYAQPSPDKSEVNRLLALFGLGELANRKPSQLSGGQKQRVALARALASKPSLLLLDEPLSALDANMRRQLQDEIALAHRDQSTTTLMVSHDLAEVFRLASRVALLEHHTVARVGSPDSLFIDNRISGKFQIVGEVVRIEPHETMYLMTVVTGQNQLVKVMAFDNDIENIGVGDKVMVFTKALNPMVMKMEL
jgi:molybdate transport system ATP-binding protein